MEEEHIVNCLGYGAKKIFGDELLVPGKGYVLEFSNPEKIKYSIMLKKEEKLNQYMNVSQALSQHDTTSDNMHKSMIGQSFIEFDIANPFNFAANSP